LEIEIRLDPNCKEPKIIVISDRMTDEINAVLKRLSEEQPQMIAGFREGTVEVLDPADIYRISATSGKVLAETTRGEYVLRMRLSGWRASPMYVSRILKSSI